MIARLVRWLAVRMVAFALARGLPTEEVMTIMTRAWRHRPGAWRLGILEDAQARVAAKGSR